MDWAIGWMGLLDGFFRGGRTNIKSSSENLINKNQMDNIASNDTILFKKAEDLKVGDKYRLNDTIYTVTQIRYLRCRGTVHHKLRNVIFSLQSDDDTNMTTTIGFRIGYRNNTYYFYE
jgi:hypothetical protein